MTQDPDYTKEEIKALKRRPASVRRRLPDERQSITHRFDIAGHEGYITVGLYEDGQPGELFLTIAKEGSMISGFADVFAHSISISLQYGVPLQDLVEKFSHVRFEPSGMTKNPDIRFAKSIVDYIFRWLAVKFLTPEGAKAALELAKRPLPENSHAPEPPPCRACGCDTERIWAGKYRCTTCGEITKA